MKNLQAAQRGENKRRTEEKGRREGKKRVRKHWDDRRDGGKKKVERGHRRWPNYRVITPLSVGSSSE